MTSAPPQPSDTISRRPVRFVVLLGNENGDRPSLADENDTLTVMEIRRAAGGKRLDTCKLRYELAKAGERLLDTTVPIGHDRIVDVRRLDSEGGLGRVEFFGKIAKQPQLINGNTEAVEVLCQLDHSMFGSRLRNFPVFEPPVEDDDDDEGIVREVDRPWVFNPSIDNKIEPNRSTEKHDSVREADEENEVEEEFAYVFVEPESIQDSELWTLKTAVHRLCWTLNPDETYIANPTLEDLESSIFPEDDADDPLKALSIPINSSLPEALDLLLEPYGYSWQRETTADVEDPENPDSADFTETKLVFFKLGEGVDVALSLQRPGTTIDYTQTVLTEFAATYSIVDLVNRVRGFSQRKRREITVELHPLWDSIHDEVDYHDLERGKVTLARRFVGRRFGLNESGKYNALRPVATEQHDTTTAYDFKPILGDETVTRDRRFLPPLSRDADDENTPREVLLQWLNPDSDEEAEADQWEEVPWSYSLYDDECTILFTRAAPPDKLWEMFQDDPESVRLRITATVEGDYASWGDAQRQESSPNGTDVQLILDLSHKFGDRQVHSSSVWYDDRENADTADDEDAIQTYCEQVRDFNDLAKVAVSIPLDGVDHPELEIGKLVGLVAGRNLTLNAKNLAQGTPHSLQILGYTLQLSEDSQRMELILESFDEEILLS